MTQTVKTTKKPTILWETLPDDFVLPDDPGENTLQPLLAAALSEALDLAGVVSSEMLITSNVGICATVDGRIVVKAPDWFYVPRVLPVGKDVIRRSYTPHREGEIPAVVMEFLSDTDAEEYSIRPTYPYGKLWFYERILQVPVYVIFDPYSGSLEVRQLINQHYEVQSPNSDGRYPVTSLGLSLGVWEGTRLQTSAHWLRWWDASGTLLLWGSEQIGLEQQRTAQQRHRAERERQRAEQERQRAETAEQRIVRLQELLRQAGISEADISRIDD